MARTYEGGCSCGAVRFRLTAAPMFVHCCHCLDCQKQTGGAFAINAMIESEDVELLAGKPVAYEMPTESGRPHDIHRCPDCEVAVWSDYGRRGWMVFVRVSTLDEPHAIEPDVHIFTRSKVPWVRLPDGARAFEIYYDRDKEWPAESVARIKAASAKAKAGG
jgi:hypothetical protein